MLREKSLCVRAARSRGCYCNEVTFGTMQDPAAILSSNSLQLRKLRKPIKTLCQARNNWPEGHHQPLLRHLHAVGSAVLTPNATLRKQTRSPWEPIAAAFCLQIKLPKIRREICLINPNSAVTCVPLTRISLPWLTEYYGLRYPSCVQAAVNDLLISTVINYFPSVKVNTLLALDYLK